MSVANPANRITRWSVVGMEGMWSKMFDPPTTSPATAEQLALTQQGQIRPNPVPEVMAAAGFQGAPTIAHTVQRDLLHTLSLPTWDGRTNLIFYVIGDPDNPAAASGTYPGPTVRMPRGVIFQAETQGKGPPPHTIHWHGIEPTPLNDGVGHCSMEIGKYVYQWQPNFMGFYFLHCHRNTVQHFEFGLFSAMVFEAPDAYFGSIASTNANGSVVLKDLAQFPIGGGRDGKRRCACNLVNFPQFPGFNSNPLDAPDPGPRPGDTQISFATDPHAMTVPFDVEALMVFDDRDSTWTALAPGAFTTFPAHGARPGFDDSFARNPGAQGFAAFNDFNADYWFVTGVPIPAPKGGTGTIPAGLTIPPALNSGITGTQISISAQTNQTILVRILDAAYNCLRVTFPVNVVIIAWDGRALGVPPYGFNEAFLVPAGTPIEMTVARRFDALIRSSSPINDFIVAEFINHNSQSPDPGEREEVVMTARVPINIGGTPVAPPTFTIKGRVIDQLGAAVTGVSVQIASATLGGTGVQTVLTDANGNFTSAGVTNGTYEITPTLAGRVMKSATGTPTAIVTVNDQILTVPNFTASIATFSPGSYSINEALDSLRSIVGIKTPTPAEVLRFDVSPIFNGIPTPDGAIDVRDSLNILRMVVGLNPV